MTHDINTLPNVRRLENFSKHQMQGVCMDLTHAVYPHDEVYGKFCTLQEYIECPPEKVFEYLAHTPSLQEWTYSLRDMMSTDIPDTWVFKDKIGEHTTCFCKTIANRAAMTVDYHCAWDQGKHLWMIYLMRVIPAQTVLNKPGSVVLWTNCHHPFYDENPYPDTAPQERPVWVGDFWSLFYAGHWIEMQNLKHILEFRHRHQLPVISLRDAGLSQSARHDSAEIA